MLRPRVWCGQFELIATLGQAEYIFDPWCQGPGFQCALGSVQRECHRSALIPASNFIGGVLSLAESEIRSAMDR